MKIAELRIGNTVEVNNKYVTVKSIEFNPVSNEYYLRVGEQFGGIKAEFVNHIPLTEEWLLRFGFEDLYYVEDKFGWIKDGVNISKYFNFVLMLPNGEYYDSTKIKYVHELQNFYFAITGMELTINKL